MSSSYRWAYYLSPQGCPLSGVMSVSEAQVEVCGLQLGVLEVNGKAITVAILTDEQAAMLDSQRAELVMVNTGSV
ncbi:MAG: hypothetical protein VKP62_06350 [Candidatus Sericytochromatia bacterium]|nr:hypothetical protein [Candidatus Sericytochromatia bacterium]